LTAIVKMNGRTNTAVYLTDVELVGHCLLYLFYAWKLFEVVISEKCCDNFRAGP
jgi:hypothetical protein